MLTILCVATYFKGDAFLRQFGLVKATACKGRNGCVRSLVLPRHDHMSEVYAINTADTLLTDEILDFVRTTR